MAKRSRDEWVQAAARAHTNLTMFHAVIALAESGCFYGATPPELTAITAAAKRGAQKQLRLYDAARARVEDH